MVEAGGVEAAAEGGLHFVVAPGVVGAAEVVDVVIAFGAEVVGHGHFTATGGPIATPGERAVVIDYHAAARGAEVGFPGVAEAVFEIAVEVQRVSGHLIGAALVGE